MNQPYFSIVIPVYNRETYITGCIKSCLDQTFNNLEIVVVNDGSTDNTASTLNHFNEPSLRVIEHLENRGINAARATGRKAAVGQWIVNLDSDWELFPFSLQRLYELTLPLRPEVVGVRARQVLDTGLISPPFMPPEALMDYIGRLKYMEMGGGYDVLGCYRREIFDRLVTYPERRGGSGTIFLEVLNLHQQGLMLHVDDVLCKQYTDAPNSVTRGNVKTRVRDLKRSAPDMLWMFEETIRLHGKAFMKYAPNQHLYLYKRIAMQYFYLGRRREGARALLHYLRGKPCDLVTWGTLVLGLAGPAFVLYGNALRHSLRNYGVLRLQNTHKKDKHVTSDTFIITG